MATEQPHQHRSVHDWVMVFECFDDRQSLLTACAAARDAWSDRAHGLDAWVDHVSACPACHEIARIEGLLADGSLDCPECRDALQVLFDLVDVAEHYEPVTVLELHRAERFLEELAPLSLDQQITQVRAVDYYQQWGMAQKLLQDAKAAWHRDPELAHDRALVAVAVASRLDPESYGADWIADLQAKAHAYLGNAYRILGRFSEAEVEFTLAEAHLDRGVRSGLAEARVLSLKASLLKDQHRHREALALLAQVERFYEEHGERHEVGRVALKRAQILYYLGQASQAALECTRASAALDPKRDPLLPLYAQKNTVEYFLSAGELEDARNLFDQLPTMPEPLDELRRSWVEANLLRAEGRYADARTAYEHVRTGFVEAGIFYDAALVSLDLALTTYEEGHEPHQVKLLAEAATVQLTLAGAKAEAYTALRMLLQAIREDTLNAAVLEGVRQRVSALQPS